MRTARRSQGAGLPLSPALELVLVLIFVLPAQVLLLVPPVPAALKVPVVLVSASVLRLARLVAWLRPPPLLLVLLLGHPASLLPLILVMMQLLLLVLLALPHSRSHRLLHRSLRSCLSLGRQPRHLRRRRRYDLFRLQRDRDHRRKRRCSSPLQASLGCILARNPTMTRISPWRLCSEAWRSPPWRPGQHEV